MLCRQTSFAGPDFATFSAWNARPATAAVMTCARVICLPAVALLLLAATVPISRCLENSAPALAIESSLQLLLGRQYGAALEVKSPRLTDFESAGFNKAELATLRTVTLYNPSASFPVSVQLLHQGTVVAREVSLSFCDLSGLCLLRLQAALLRADNAELHRKRSSGLTGTNHSCQ